MATLTIRNLDDAVVERLKQRARANDRSLEAEVRQMLTQGAERMSRAELVRRAEEMAERTRGRIRGDSTDLVREDRDR
jgi:plasmid stability protein